MISIKNAKEIEQMKKSGAITAAARKAAKAVIRPGVTTKHIDRAVHAAITAAGATPTFLGYGGFPGSACVSVNDEVIHGIPGDRVVHEGDLVKIDVGAFYDGFTGDCAATFPVGEISDDAKKLIAVTRQSFYEGIKFARVGHRVSDISHAIQVYAESFGYGVVRRYIGHGVGRKLHEDPEVPNFGKPGHGPRLLPGMTIAIEPMINIGTYDVVVMPDDWTVKTADRSLSAHYEHSVLITTGDPVLLTSWEE
jgi:methionyl aminopeptidase